MFRFDVLEQADIAALLHLVGEVTELPSDKVVRRTHVLHRLLKLVGGRSAVAVEMADPDEGPFACAGAVINVDYSCEAEVRGSEMYLVHNNPPDPALNDFLAAHGKTITMVRDLDDREWYRSAHYDIVRRPYDMDHSLYCRLTLPDGQDMAVGLQRCPGDPVFSERDKSLVHLLHTSAPHVYYAPVAPARTAIAGAAATAGAAVFVARRRREGSRGEIETESAHGASIHADDLRRTGHAQPRRVAGEVCAGDVSD